MAFREPELLHTLLNHFAESIANYLRYQIDSGAQVVQMFDSWAGQLSPADYDTFAAPYQKKVVDLVKQTHPDTPFVLYISGSAGVLERMARTGVDIISLDWTVDMAEAVPAFLSTSVCREMWIQVCYLELRMRSKPASMTPFAKRAVAATF